MFTNLKKQLKWSYAQRIAINEVAFGRNRAERRAWWFNKNGRKNTTRRDRVGEVFYHYQRLV